MKFKTLALASVMLLVAACETAPVDEGTGTGTGAGYNGSGSGPVTPGSQEDLAANVGDRVFYALDSSVLDAEDMRTLERQAQWLQKYNNVNVVVEGHCDERGTREYNLALGERRAAAAKNYLVSLGINAGRVSTISYGKERPVAVGHDDGSWAQNRRAVTVVVGN